MNSFGSKFRISIFGESHGTAIGVVIDGVPPGVELSEDDLRGDIARRKSGARGTTQRKEADVPYILSGTYNGRTTGAPLTVLFHNKNTVSGDYKNLADHPRPSHADFVAARKYLGFNDPRGGGHFSGRITLPLVAAGAVAKKLLKGISIEARTVAIGGSSDPVQFDRIVSAALADGDSVGGIVECRATGLPVGLGEPFFDSVEGLVSHLVFAIPAVRGIEFGNGFGAAALRGSQNNDMIVSESGLTATNNAGGINGGVTNGNDMVFRVAIKPTPSIALPQQTFNTRTGRVETLEIRGRHDACIALRAPVVVEAALAIALAQFI
ncbi:MAG: chorismate synthase [Rikenellaceae bacterium]|nr:chorismate synthase [Rikenellaceae bacterium]